MSRCSCHSNYRCKRRDMDLCGATTSRRPRWLLWKPVLRFTRFRQRSVDRPVARYLLPSALNVIRGDFVRRFCLQEVIKDVTGAAEQSGFPLFVLDQNALQCFAEKPSLADRSGCSSALREQTVVQFGSLGQFVSQKVRPFYCFTATAIISDETFWQWCTIAVSVLPSQPDFASS